MTLSSFSLTARQTRQGQPQMGVCCWPHLLYHISSSYSKVLKKKKSLRAGKTGPDVCFEIKGIKRGLFRVICILLSLSLPRPPTLPWLTCCLTPNPQAFTPQLAAWLRGSGERQEEPFLLQPGSSCSSPSSGSSTRFPLEQGPATPHTSWQCTSRRTLLFGKGSPRIFPRRPIFMAAVGA